MQERCGRLLRESHPTEDSSGASGGRRAAAGLHGRSFGSFRASATHRKTKKHGAELAYARPQGADGASTGCVPLVSLCTLEMRVDDDVVVVAVLCVLGEKIFLSVPRCVYVTQSLQKAQSLKEKSCSVDMILRPRAAATAASQGQLKASGRLHLTNKRRVS